MKKRKKTKTKRDTFWKSLIIHDNEMHPGHQKILNMFFWVIAVLFVVTLVAFLIVAV